MQCSEIENLFFRIDSNQISFHIFPILDFYSETEGTQVDLGGHFQPIRRSTHQSKEARIKWLVYMK